MMDTLEHSVEVQDKKQEIPGVLLVGVFVVFYLILAMLGPVNIIEGELLGTDSYTRLNRVQFVYEQGDWNQSIYPRSNAPYGESIHWTKPMDFLLLTGGSFFALMMPFSMGLHVWGVLISPILHVLTFIGIVCFMREELDRLGMIVLAIVFLLQPVLISYFMIGRPDHHSLILTVFCWFLVGLLKGYSKIPNWKHSLIVGGLGALGVWISVEFLVPIFLFLAAYTVVWVWREKTLADHTFRIMSAMFLSSAIALLIERSDGDFFIVEYDKISIAHCVLLGFITVVWFGIYQLGPSSRWTATNWSRFAVIGTLSLLTSVVYWSLFPEFFKGPLVGMDTTIRHLIWDNVAETQPLQISDAIMNLGMGILVLPYLVYAMRRETVSSITYEKFTWLLGASLFIPLGLHEARWTPYASIILLIPYVEYVRNALSWIESQWPARRNEAASLVLGLVLVFWPVTVGSVAAFDEPAVELSTMGGKCPIVPLAEYLNRDLPTGLGSKAILAFKDFGPELLYRTSHRVVATPMHRNQEGIRDLYQIMSAVNVEESHRIIQRRMIDLLVICATSEAESNFYSQSTNSKTFHEKLLSEPPPHWLKEVSLPAHLEPSFRVFEYVNK